MGPSWASFGLNLKPLGRLLASTWSLLDASWAELGASWAPPGRLWGSSWGLLGASWASLGSLGRILGQLGASWVPIGRQLGAKWMPHGRHMGAKWASSELQVGLPSWTATTAASFNILLKNAKTAAKSYSTPCHQRAIVDGYRRDHASMYMYMYIYIYIYIYPSVLLLLYSDISADGEEF